MGGDLKETFGRLKCYLICGLLLLLLIDNMVSVDGTGHQNVSINVIDDTLKESLKEKSMSLSSSYFIQNIGQIDSNEIQFYSRGGNIFFTPDAVLYRFSEMEPIDEDGSGHDHYNRYMKETPNEYHEWGVVLKYSFIGSNNVIPEGRDQCTWNTNYFKGSDPEKWYTEVPNYKEIVYPELWDGIDLVYRLKEGSIKYDLIVHPGADPSDIRIRIDGANGLSINLQGDLVIGTDYWDIIDSGLISYYGDGSGGPIPVKFVLMNECEYNINLGAFDKRRSVVIDPLIDYSTFIGGSKNEGGSGIAIDTNGNAYITGSTDDVSTNFPITIGAYDTTHNGVSDVFVTKLNPAGSSLVYSTFIGGSSTDEGHSIVVDSSGNAYITGFTNDASTNFPTTTGAYDTTQNGGHDVFVSMLNPAGSSLVYSTLIGGSSTDEGYDITIDTSGNAYITGHTRSGTTAGYPTTTGAYDTTHNGRADVFMTKLDPTGSSLVYSTFIGGSDNDRGHGIAIDASGNAYVTGWAGSSSIDYPTTSGAYDTTHNGGMDVFVTKLNSAGSSLVYSTFIGGSDHDEGWGIAIDASRSVYITGFTNDASTNFPTTTGAYDTTHNGGVDVFVTKVNTTGSSLVYSTFIGGVDHDRGWGIAIDPSGNAYITGQTGNGGIKNYPTTSGAYDTTYNGGMNDVFMTRLNSTGSSLVYSTLIGGSDDDRGWGIAIYPSGNASITGYTGDGTADYPTSSGAYDTTHNGGNDVFVTSVVSDDVSQPSFGLDSSTLSATTGDQFTFSIEVTDNIEVFSVFVEYWFGIGIPMNMSMTGSDPYTYKITVPSHSTESLSYIFHATDSVGNWAHTSPVMITVKDNDVPVFGIDGSDTTGATGDSFSFSVDVSDNIGVSGVYVEYWFGSGHHLTTIMQGSGSYWINITISSDSTETLQYIFHVNDTADNWNHTIQRNVSLMDNDRPIFGTDSTPSKGTTGDQFTFTIQIIDNIGVSGAFVEYWFGSGNSINQSMLGSGPHTFTITIPSDSIETLHYIFHVNDTADNWNHTIQRNVSLLDKDRPIFGTDSTPGISTTGDQFTFAIQVTDNIAVSTVWIEYWFGEGTHTNDSMSGNGEYTYPLLIPLNSTDSLHYIIHANDISSNWNETDTFDVPIIDNDHPYFGTLSIPVSIGTGEILDCYIQVFDNIEIDAVYFEYWFGFGSHTNITISGSNPYSFYVKIPENSIDPLNYLISAVDGNGNWISLYDDVTVIDIIGPISQPGPDLTHNEDSPIILNGLLSTDNIGIVNWTWKFFESDVEVILYGMERSYIFNQPGKYQIFLKVTDVAMNWQESSFNIIVKDITNPIIDISSLEVDEDSVVTFDGSRCTDNVGIVNWTWSFDDGNGPKTLYGESISNNFSIPGNYTITLTVKDEASNSATDTMMVNVRSILDTHGGDDEKSILDYWWIVLFLLILLILIGGILFVLMRKKTIESLENFTGETIQPPSPIETEGEEITREDNTP